MGAIQQFLGNTVGEKGLSHTGIPVEEEILELKVKLFHEDFRLLKRRLGGLPCAQASRVIFYFIRIVIQREVVKVLFFQDFLEIGLPVQKINHCFLKAGALFAADISGVLA